MKSVYLWRIALIGFVVSACIWPASSLAQNAAPERQRDRVMVRDTEAMPAQPERNTARTERTDRVERTDQAEARAPERAEGAGEVRTQMREASQGARPEDRCVMAQERIAQRVAQAEVHQRIRARQEHLIAVLSTVAQNVPADATITQELDSLIADLEAEHSEFLTEVAALADASSTVVSADCGSQGEMIKTQLASMQEIWQRARASHEQFRELAQTEGRALLSQLRAQLSTQESATEGQQ